MENQKESTAVRMKPSSENYAKRWRSMDSKVVTMDGAPLITDIKRRISASTHGKIALDNDDGGGTMEDKYATKEELKTLDTKVSGQFETLMAKMDGKFNTMNAKTDGKFDELNATITGSFKSAKAETESRFSKLEAIQSKWFIGTAIAIVGLVVALLKFF